MSLCSRIPGLDMPYGVLNKLMTPLHGKRMTVEVRGQIVWRKVIIFSHLSCGKIFGSQPSWGIGVRYSYIIGEAILAWHESCFRGEIDG